MSSKKTFNMIVISFIIVMTLFISKNLLDRHKLNKEVNKLYESIITEYDYKEVYDKINTIKTKDGYALVEEASKDYLFSLLQIITDYDKLIFKERNIIEIGNYKKDGPSFNDTINYINNYKNNLSDIKNRYTETLDEENANKYINEKGLKTSYEKMFKKMKFYKNIDKLKEEKINQIDDKLNKLNLENDIILYLKNNPYTITNNKVVFKGDNSKYLQLLDEYNKKYRNE